MEQHRTQLEGPLRGAAGDAAAEKAYLRIFTEGHEKKQHRSKGGNAGAQPSSVSVLPEDAFSISEQAPSLGFRDWWAWCQKCKHGGHAAHLARWFETHKECPVSDCTCTCC